jgi:hypothetical protein
MYLNCRGKNVFSLNKSEKIINVYTVHYGTFFFIGFVKLEITMYKMYVIHDLINYREFGSICNCIANIFTLIE